MPKLSSLTRAHPVSVTFEAEDESLTVVFDRNKITPIWMDRVRRITETQDFDAILTTTLEVIVSWDVEDEAGNPLPISAEILGQLPFDSFKRLNDAIAEAALPSSAEGEASGGLSSGSPPERSTPSTPQLPVSQPTPLNGQEPSPSPTPSASPSPT